MTIYNKLIVSIFILFLIPVFSESTSTEISSSTGSNLTDSSFVYISPRYPIIVTHRSSATPETTIIDCIIFFIFIIFILLWFF